MKFKLLVDFLEQKSRILSLKQPNFSLFLQKISECAAKGGECDENKGRPVCGTDGQTYPTRCHLIRAQCSGHQVSLKHRGTCKGNFLQLLQYLNFNLIHFKRRLSGVTSLRVSSSQNTKQRIEIRSKMSQWWYLRVGAVSRLCGLLVCQSARKTNPEYESRLRVRTTNMCAKIKVQPTTILSAETRSAN